MMPWRASTWGDEISLEYGKSLRDYSERTGPYRVYGSNGAVGWTTSPLAPGPGVILGRKGAYRGVQYSPAPFFVIDTAYYLKPKSEMDMRWLYYAVIYYKLGEIDDGSPIPSTTRAAVYVCDFEVPPLPEQQAIARILGALDDKIELNRQMNETLEAMARAIFKDWFVDFGPTHAKMQGRAPYLAPDLWALFPDRIDDAGKPEGWIDTILGDICTRIAMGPFGSDIKVENFVSEGVPVVRGGNLKDGFIDDDFAYLSQEKADSLKNSIAYPGDIIITHRGTLGQVGIIPATAKFPRYVVSQSQMLLAADKSKLSPGILFEFLRSGGGMQQLLLSTSQTGVPAIAKPVSAARAIKFIKPPKVVLDGFDFLNSPLVEKVNANKLESRSLAQIRDILLPKLMSGEIHVRDAEKTAETVL